jgi:hypothetical protein
MIPEPILPIVDDYITLMNARLPDRLDAFYIVGSIALGEFNEQFSDVDFITVLNRKVTPGEIEELRNLHRFIDGNHPRWKMSGSYIQRCDLGKPHHQIEPYPYYQDGVFYPNSHSGLNPVTWWELKNHGIAVAGTEPQELPFTVDWDQLVLWMKKNMNSYWAHWTTQPARILTMYSNWGIQWAVLGILRQLYTFQESSITTKVRAARYALGCLPARWHKLVQEAIDIREGKKESAYRFRTARMIAAVRFLKYVIQSCNASDPLK